MCKYLNQFKEQCVGGIERLHKSKTIIAYFTTNQFIMKCGFTEVNFKAENETPCSLRDAKSMCTVALHHNCYIMFTGA